MRLEFERFNPLPARPPAAADNEQHGSCGERMEQRSQGGLRNPGGAAVLPLALPGLGLLVVILQSGSERVEADGVLLFEEFGGGAGRKGPGKRGGAPGKVGVRAIFGGKLGDNLRPSQGVRHLGLRPVKGRVRVFRAAQ